MANKTKGSKEKRGGTPSQAGERVAQFFKKNIYIILMVVCILAIATMITVAVVVNNNDEPTFNPNPSGDINSGDINSGDDNDDDDKDDNTGGDITEQPEEFVVADPIKEYTLGQGFSDTELVFDPTHGHWATHEGMDFMAAAGTDVMSVFEGTVKSVETDSYYGTTVVIEHKDGFESVYKLLDKVSLKKGDKVTKGQVIGKVSGTALAEIASGAHLHLELYKDGEKINPQDYMLGGDK